MQYLFSSSFLDHSCLKPFKFYNVLKSNQCDAPPSSLIDSTVSPNMKTLEGEGVEVCSLVRNTSKVKGHARVSKWRLGKLTSMLITHTDLHKPKTSWLMHSWNTFNARTSHEQTTIYNTHHGSNLGEATTFPLIVFFVLGHGAST